MLSLSCDSMPVFNNLKSLNIKSHKERGWQAVPVLLRNCPRLETIVFEVVKHNSFAFKTFYKDTVHIYNSRFCFQGLIHYVTDDCGDACGCISREDKGRCSLVSCPVKKIQIHGFEMTVPEMKVIRHFLVSLQCLKEMKIYAKENDPTNLPLPAMFELIEMAMKFYSQEFKCDVSFIRPGS